MIRFDRDMSKRTFINNLLEAGLIERHSSGRGWYVVPSRPGQLYHHRSLIWVFGKEVAPGRFIYKKEAVEALIQENL